MIPPGIRRVDPNAQAGYPKPQLVEVQARLNQAFEQLTIKPQTASSSSSSTSTAASIPRLTLAEFIGFNGRLFGGLLLVNHHTQYATAFGNVVVLTSVDNPHQQIHLIDPTPAKPPALGIIAASSSSSSSSAAANIHHTNPIAVISASPSGRYLAVGGSACPSDVIIWDVEAKPAPRIHARLQHHTHGIKCIDFSQDERFLITAGNEEDRKLFIYDLLPAQKPGGQPAMVTNGTSDNIFKITFGPRIADAKGNLTPTYHVATASADRLELMIFDAQRGTFLPNGRVALGAVKRYFNCLKWSADGTLLFGGSTSGDVCVVLASTRILVQTITASATAVGAVGSINFLQDGKIILVGRKDGSLTSYESRRGLNSPYTDVAQLKLKGAITSFAQSKEFAIVGTEESTIYKVDLTKAQPTSTRLSQAHISGVRDVAFSTDASVRYFATCARDSTLQIWNEDTLEHITLGGSLIPVSAGSLEATCCAIAASSQPPQVLVGYNNGSVHSFHPQTGAELWNLPLSHKSAISTVAVSTNGRYFITTSQQGDMRAWDFSSRSLLNEVKEHTSTITAVATFTNDTRKVLSVSLDKRLVEVNLLEAKLHSCHENQMGGLTGVAWSSLDEDEVVTIGKDNALTWWTLRTVTPVATLPNAHGAGGEPLCLARSTNGRWLASGDASGKIFIWMAGSKEKKLLQTLEAHTAPCRKVAFSHEDRALISVGDDGAILKWKIEA